MRNLFMLHTQRIKKCCASDKSNSEDDNNIDMNNVKISIAAVTCLDKDLQCLKQCLDTFSVDLMFQIKV